MQKLFKIRDTESAYKQTTLIKIPMSDDRLFHSGPPLAIVGRADGLSRPPDILSSSLPKAHFQTFHDPCCHFSPTFCPHVRPKLC